jgi:uncharacterized protein with LGFP repeats
LERPEGVIVKTVKAALIASLVLLLPAAARAQSCPPTPVVDPNLVPILTGDEWYSQGPRAWCNAKDLADHSNPYGIHEDHWRTYGWHDACNINTPFGRTLNAINALEISYPFGTTQYGVGTDEILYWGNSWFRGQTDDVRPECGNANWSVCHKCIGDFVDSYIELYSGFYYDTSVSQRAGVLLHEARHYDVPHFCNDNCGPICGWHASCDYSWDIAFPSPGFWPPQEPGADMYEACWNSEYADHAANSNLLLKRRAIDAANDVLNNGFYIPPPFGPVKVPAWLDVFFNEWDKPDIKSRLGNPTSSDYYLTGTNVSVSEFAGGNVYLYATSEAPITFSAFAVFGPILTKWKNGGLGYARDFGLPIEEEKPAKSGSSDKIQEFQKGTIYLHNGAASAYAIKAGPIRDRWRELFATGTLGYPIGDTLPAGKLGDGLRQDFSNGSLYWKPGAGAHLAYMVTGAIRDQWRRQSSTPEQSWLGYPLTDELQCGLDLKGRYNLFDGGAIYWSPSTGKAVDMRQVIVNKWNWVFNAERGYFGYPTASGSGATRDHTAFYFNDFQGGASIYWSATTGAQAVQGAIRNKWRALGGGTSYLGLPLIDEWTTGVASESRYNDFQNGSIYWSPSVNNGAEAFELHGAIRDKWVLLSRWAGFLGYPISDEKTTSGTYGEGKYNNFQNGTIYWSASVGNGQRAYEVHGAIRDKWNALGGPSSFLGYPMTDESLTGANEEGRYNDFQADGKGGSIYWRPGYPPYEVHGAIRKLWLDMGGTTGVAGYPTSDEVMGVADPKGHISQFETCWISDYAASPGGTHPVCGNMLTSWIASGQERVIGYPTEDAVYHPETGKWTQVFQKQTLGVDSVW